MHSIGGPELPYSFSFAPAEVGNSAAVVNNAAYFMTEFFARGPWPSIAALPPRTSGD
jgi:hypothetical protein